ncbi:MAG: peptidoglycan DD-metalloendopeptidase family protein, partial [Simkaniaceae bacterium]|nr:peptidoglycan DD-metalloendopeptidase family protein [Simkaniaceae bacterium]
MAQRGSRNFDSEIQSQSKAIESLRKEIIATRNRIEREGQKEKSTAKNISNIEQEISLLDRLLSELNREIQNAQRTIISLESQVEEKEHELRRLKDRYAKRVVSVYKKGTLLPLEQVFSSTSWRQAVYRAKYLSIISDIDRKTQNQIQSLIIDISQKKLNREVAVRESNLLRKEQEREQYSLRSKKRQKEKELRKIRQNKEQMAEIIREKQAGIKQLAAMRKKILEDKDRFEREERLRKQREVLKAKNFADLEGKLPWPASGRIITQFGREWNPKLKTTTENPGIDIKGKPGSPITTVMNGIVISITYIRGYGTTMIIDHGAGFFTVYSHVTN